MACAPGTIIEGSTPVLELTFRDPNRVLEDPVSILAVHRPPSGTEASYADSDPELVQQSTGIWWLTLPAVTKGRHTVHVTGTGSSTVASSTYRFPVKADGVTTV
jgi:hypothetical protein